MIMLQTYNGQSHQWSDEKLRIKSIALSCLRLHVLYGNVSLYTDEEGERILIDTLKLPYSSVRLIRDDKVLSGHSATRAKIYSWQMQEEPFLFVGSDVYFWRPLDPALMQQPVITFFEDRDDVACFKDASITRKLFRGKPVSLFSNEKIDIGQRKYFPSFNTGICGGTDYLSLRQYSQEVFSVLEHPSVHGSDVSCEDAADRHFLYCFLKNNSMPCGTVLRFPLNFNISAFSIFEDLGRKTGISWVPDGMKNREDVARMVSLKLEEEFPEYYRRIEELFLADKSITSVSANIRSTHSHGDRENIFCRTQAVASVLGLGTGHNSGDDKSFADMVEEHIAKGIGGNLLADAYAFECARNKNIRNAGRFVLLDRSLQAYRQYDAIASLAHVDFLALNLVCSFAITVHVSRWYWCMDVPHPSLPYLKAVYNIATPESIFHTLFLPVYGAYASHEYKLDDMQVLLLSQFKSKRNILAAIEAALLDREGDDLKKDVSSCIEKIKEWICLGILVAT